MSLNERILSEFCIYYKRIMRIEKYLKALIAEKYFSEYGNKAYEILYKRYFSTLRKNTGIKVTPFECIYSSIKKTDKDKLLLSIDKLYISEVLSLFSHKVYLKNSVRHNFFPYKVKTNTNAFRKTAKSLKEFRNTICHFDIQSFKNDKSRFAEALIFFERLLNCRYKFTAETFGTIEHKLSIKSILELIYRYNPEYFSDDRILVNVFDDIALLTGFRTNDLPQYKSIIRAKFTVQTNMKSK